MNFKIIYPLQGEHYEDVRKEALEFVVKNKQHIDGVYVCGLFNESNIIDDIENTKKASKFYNLHLENNKIEKELNKDSLKNLIEKGKKKSSNQSSFLNTFNFQNRKKIYKLILENLPQNESKMSTYTSNNDLKNCFEESERTKLILNSNGNLFKIIEGSYYGFQIFESGFAFELAKERKSIFLNFNELIEAFIIVLEKGMPTNISQDKIESEIIKIINTCDKDVQEENISLGKRDKIKDFSVESLHSLFETLKEKQNTKLEITNETEMIENLIFSKNLEFQGKLQFNEELAHTVKPIVCNCECYSCKTYTQAYLHHLLKHNEMLGSVILSIHNNFMYKQFFELLNYEVVRNNILIFSLLLKIFNKD